MLVDGPVTIRASRLSAQRRIAGATRVAMTPPIPNTSGCGDNRSGSSAHQTPTSRHGDRFRPLRAGGHRAAGDEPNRDSRASPTRTRSKMPGAQVGWAPSAGFTYCGMMSAFS